MPPPGAAGAKQARDIGFENPEGTAFHAGLPVDRAVEQDLRRSTPRLGADVGRRTCVLSPRVRRKPRRHMGREALRAVEESTIGPLSERSRASPGQALHRRAFEQGRTMLNKRRRALAVLVLLLGVLSAGELHAAKVQFAVTPLRGSTWRYDYSIVNDSPFGTSELRVFFEPTTFAALSAVATPPGEWLSSVLQPIRGSQRTAT